MNEAEKLICRKIFEFVDEHWNEIDLDMMEISQTKDEFLNDVLNDVQLALWVFTEVADWGMEKKYLKDWIVEQDNDDFIIIKLDGKFIKLYAEDIWSDWQVSFVKPKQKTVYYFE